METEIWTPVIGFEKSYAISNYGKIKSLDRFVNSKNKSTRFVRGIIKKQALDRCGYLRISLWRERRAKPMQVHRLVASHFIPNPLNKPQINHIDGNKQNNNSNNLEWCTSKENIHHSIAMGLTQNKGEFNGRHILTKQDVIKIRSEYKPHVVTLDFLANKYGVSNATIQKIVYNKNWKDV